MPVARVRQHFVRLTEAARRLSDITTGDGPIQFLIVLAVVALIQAAAFMVPDLLWLPNGNDADSYLKVLWQVHASLLAVTVVVVTIIVTVIANEKDRKRTWKLYAEKTRFTQVVWFNLLAVASEGVASIQTYSVSTPLFSSDKTGNLILFEGLLFLISVSLAAMLFTITLRFLDDDYIEDLAEQRIVRAMPGAVEKDLAQMEKLVTRLKGDSGGR